MEGIKDLSPVVESCVERVKEGLERTLAGVREWREEDSELGKAEVVFLMAVSALANHDIEMSGMLLKEVKRWSVLPLMKKYLSRKTNAEWEVPREVLDKALRFVHFLEVSGLFFVPPELPAYLTKLLAKSEKPKAPIAANNSPSEAFLKGRKAATPFTQAITKLIPEPSTIQTSSHFLPNDKNTGAIQKLCLLEKRKTPIAANNSLSEAFPNVRRMSKIAAQRQLWEGVEKDNVQLVLEAVACDADLNMMRADKGYRTPLALAASEGRVGAVRALIACRSQVEGRSGEEKRTVLHWASAGGHVAVVRELLEVGADKEAEDSSKYTPLHLASAYGRAAVVRELVGAGANVEAVGRLQYTPLHLASENGHEAAVLELLEAGADVGAVDWFGKTPLHIASFNGHLATVRVLVEDGAADLSTKGKAGYTPPQLARNRGHTAVAQYFCSIGAKITLSL